MKFEFDWLPAGYELRFRISEVEMIACCWYTIKNNGRIVKSDSFYLDSLDIKNFEDMLKNKVKFDIAYNDRINNFKYPFDQSHEAVAASR